MTDKLPDVVDRVLDSYTDILINFPPDAQKQTSRYYETDSQHIQILNKLASYGKKTEKFTSADGQRLKQMLIDSLDLADRKVRISDCLMDIVGKNTLKFNMNIKEIEMTMTQVSQNKTKIKPQKMLKWLPNYREIDSVSIDGVINVDNSNEHTNKNKIKITKTSNKNSKIKSNLDTNFQTSKTIITGTNQSIKNTTMSKNRSTQRSQNRRKVSESSNSDTDIQPTYCVCEEISYGDMVCCDNDLCPIEWFHFSCVSVSRKPKGKWYCPKCRGTNSKTMKPREVFLKELEEYNKSKEEEW